MAKKKTANSKENHNFELMYNELMKLTNIQINKNIATQNKPQYVIKTYATYGMHQEPIF